MGIYWNKDAKTEHDEPPARTARPKAKPRPGPAEHRGRTWTSPAGTDEAEGNTGDFSAETPSRKR